MSQGKRPQIGIIGAGEMGAAVGAALNSTGLTVRTVLNGRSEETRHRAQNAGLGAAENLETLVGASDIVFSILPPSQAASAASEVAHIVKTLRQPLTFVEANAVSPATVLSISQSFAGTVVRFVDGGLVGGPPRGDRRPRLYASGDDCDLLKSLDSAAFDLRRLGPDVGKASGFKMAYAALTKGMNTLLTAGLLAAEEMGFLDTYIAELESSQNAVLKKAEANIPRLPADAARWIREMEEIRDTFQGLRLPGGFHQGAADIMRLLASSRYGHETRQTRDTTRSMRQTVSGIAEDRRSKEAD
ncbi:DUF1932 domain-containing protein [Hoeflea sp. TYP-13]|uniref:NAD(P)-dependent oxidoreductase n=1 Tax=Hoeflea sp. TYP-13 TaxID=3230023 RepID=UPI0034C5DDBF